MAIPPECGALSSDLRNEAGSGLVLGWENVDV